MSTAHDASRAAALTTSEEARTLLAHALESARTAGATQAEAILDDSDLALTRFANNEVHQNVAARRGELTLRVFDGNRSGVAATDRLDRDAVAQCAAQALAIARLMPPDDESIELPGPAPVTALDGVRPATAAATADDRAAAVARVIAAVRAKGLTTAGALSHESTVRAVANSKGVFAAFPGTLAHFTCTVLAPDSSGWVDAYDRDASRIDTDALAARAIDKAQASAAPRALPAGKYTVILEPPAVAELVAFLAFLGFGAQQVQEGQSFLVGRMGQRITGERITISDDPFHARGAGVPFDCEGVPRRPLTLVEQGVARACVHETRTARREATASTGHASTLPPRAEGPLPYDLVLAPGSSSVEEMVARTERGILVTRFWYNRVVDPRRTVITGMTRDGTFLVEDGRIVGGVRNLRFNDSVLDVLARADLIGAEPALTVFDWSHQSVVAPALRSHDFHFTGVTTF